MGYAKVVNNKQCWCYFYCLTDINDCHNNTCEQRCIDHLGYYSCDCFSGYHLMDDHRSCEGEKIVRFPSLKFSSIECYNRKFIEAVQIHRSGWCW